MSSDFAANLARGLLGESRIARWLVSRGLVVLPAYEVEIDSGKGPRVFAPSGRLVSPDLLAVKPGASVLWIEAKHKTVFSWRRCHPGPRWETGVDLHHFRDYCRVADATGLPVWLVFLHTDAEPARMDANHCDGPSPTGLFAIDIQRARKRARIDEQPRAHARRGMAYWGARDLSRVASVADIPDH